MPSTSSPAKVSSPDREDAPSRSNHESSRDLAALETRRASRTSVPQYYGSTERTPLLDPDDSAVTIYNLQSVHFLRGVLWVMVGLNTLVALLLFVNSFVSIPYLTLRSSGFVELDYAVLSLIALLLSLLTFAVPSEAEVWLGYFVTALMALQLILAISIPHIRHFYGFIGFFVFAWTFLAIGMSFVVTPYLVKVGRGYEEVRLTGRIENRRTLTEWFKLSFSLILFFVLVVIPAILLFAGFMLDIYDTARLFHEGGLASKGIFVPIQQDSGDYSVYIECTPKKEQDVITSPSHKAASPPIVLIEADDHTGAQSFYSGWVEELYNSNKVSQVCLWNRPGRGFSDVAPSPFSLNAASSALSIALECALNHTDVNITSPASRSDSPPFQNRTLALVSHGLGGLYSRAFAARHTHSIQSLLLVDTLHEDLLRSSLGRPWRGFRLWVKGIASPFALRRQLSWIIHHKGAASRYLGGKAYSTNPTEIKASLQEQISAFNGETRDLIQDANTILKDTKIPVAVVSSAETIRKNSEWSALQRKLTKITSNNVAWEILDGPHDVWTDEKAKYKLQELLVNILREPEQSTYLDPNDSGA